MRILVIDNTIDQTSWGSSEISRLAAKAPGSTVYVRRAPHEDLPSISKFDKIIVSGSKTSCLEEAPWITKLDEAIKQALNENKALLGVCYGHQALNRVVSGTDKLRRGQEAEFGWTEIETVAESNLLNGLPKKFYTFSAHFEEVAELAKGMRHLARSKDCHIQACQLETRPVYGIQFHPERTLEGAKFTFAERKKLGTPKILLRPNDSEKLFDSTVGEKIFLNFVAES